MIQKFTAFTLFALIQHLQDIKIINGADFRQSALIFLEHAELADDEKEEFKKLIISMPGIGVVK